MNGANALYGIVNFAADVLYMCVNSHVICKMEYKVISSNREWCDIVSKWKRSAA